MFTISLGCKKTKHTHLFLIWTYAKAYLCDLACTVFSHIAHFVNKPDQSGKMLLVV